MIIVTDKFATIAALTTHSMTSSRAQNAGASSLRECVYVWAKTIPDNLAAQSEDGILIYLLLKSKSFHFLVSMKRVFESGTAKRLCVDTSSSWVQIITIGEPDLASLPHLFSTSKFMQRLHDNSEIQHKFSHLMHRYYHDFLKLMDIPVANPVTQFYHMYPCCSLAFFNRHVIKAVNTFIRHNPMGRICILGYAGKLQSPLCKFSQESLAEICSFSTRDDNGQVKRSYVFDLSGNLDVVLEEKYVKTRLSVLAGEHLLRTFRSKIGIKGLHVRSELDRAYFLKTEHVHKLHHASFARLITGGCLLMLVFSFDPHLAPRFRGLDHLCNSRCLTKT